MCTLPTKWGGTELHFLTSCQMYDHISDTYFPQITQTHQELENKSNFGKLPYVYWVKYQNAVCHHSSKVCDLLPQEKGNQWRTNTTVNTTYIYVYLFSLLYYNYLLHIVTTLYNMTFEMSLFFWNFFECNVYCSVCIYFTWFGSVIYMFPMPIKPLELNWKRDRKINYRESWIQKDGWRDKGWNIEPMSVVRRVIMKRGGGFRDMERKTEIDNSCGIYWQF